MVGSIQRRKRRQSLIVIHIQYKNVGHGTSIFKNQIILSIIHVLFSLNQDFSILPLMDQM